MKPTEYELLDAIDGLTPTLRRAVAVAALDGYFAREDVAWLLNIANGYIYGGMDPRDRARIRRVANLIGALLRPPYPAPP